MVFCVPKCISGQPLCISVKNLTVLTLWVTVDDVNIFTISVLLPWELESFIFSIVFPNHFFAVLNFPLWLFFSLLVYFSYVFYLFLNYFKRDCFLDFLACWLLEHRKTEHKVQGVLMDSLPTYTQLIFTPRPNKIQKNWTPCCHTISVSGS